MAKPKIVKKSKVTVVTIRSGDNKPVTKFKFKKLPVEKKISPTRKLLTIEEKRELSSLFKLVQKNRESVHGKILCTMYDTGLRTHAWLSVKCLSGTHISLELVSPRFSGSLLTNNTTDLLKLEKSIRKARKYIEASRKINEIGRK